MINQEFESFFRQAIVPELQRCQDVRGDLKKSHKSLKQYFQLGLVISFVGTIFFVFLSAFEIGVFVVLSILFAAIAFMLVIIGTPFYYMIKNYFEKQHQIKLTAVARKSIFLPIFRYFNPDVSYRPNRSFSLKTLINSKLIYPPPTERQGEDYVKVQIGDTVVQFCRITAIKATNGVPSIPFDGIFCVAAFNKNFSGKTVVYSKGDMGVQQRINLGLKSLFKKENFVELEAVEFSEQFYVLSDNQIEARYILTSSFMRRILDYKKKLRKHISLSFIDNKLYLTIPMSQDLFSLSLDSNRNRDIKQINAKTIYYILITDLVKDLNLNNRIWSREHGGVLSDD